jgi:hypothetical protein
MSSSSFLSTALQVLFIALKLTGQITWSWWLVMLPTLIPVGIVAVIGIAYIVLKLADW